MEKPTPLPPLLRSATWAQTLRGVSETGIRDDLDSALTPGIKRIDKQWNAVRWDELAAKSYEKLKQPEALELARDKARGLWARSRTMLVKETAAILKAAKDLRKRLGRNAPQEVNALINQTESFADGYPQPFDDADFDRLIARVAKAAAPGDGKEKDKDKAKDKDGESIDTAAFRKEAQKLAAPTRQLIAVMRKAYDASEEAAEQLDDINADYKKRAKKFDLILPEFNARMNRVLAKKFGGADDSAAEMAELGATLDALQAEAAGVVGAIEDVLAKLKALAEDEPDSRLLGEVETAEQACVELLADCSDIGAFSAALKRATLLVKDGKPAAKVRLPPLNNRELVEHTNRLTRLARGWQKVK